MYFDSLLAMLPIIGAVIGILGYRRLIEKDLTDGAKSSGKLSADIKYIKNGVDEIKAEQKEMRCYDVEVAVKLAQIEGCVASHDDRISKLEERI